MPTTPKTQIAISARGYLLGFGGVRTYCRQLLPKLVSLGGTSCSFDLFVNGNCEDFVPVSDATIHRIGLGCHPVFWDHFILPGKLAQCHPDVAFFPKGQIPLGIRVPSVITVLDLGYFEKGCRYYPMLDTLYQRWALRRSIRRATHIIAISEATRQSILQHIGIPDERITVVHLGLPPPPSDEDIAYGWKTVAKKWNLASNQFIIVPKGDNHRKNTPAVVKAFLQSQASRHSRLVITGNLNPTKLLQSIPEAQNSDALLFPGVVSANELAALYAHASCCVYASLFEGFGLPILEAMQLGCPVITSNCSSMPEVAGKAALLINPQDIGDIADAIDNICFHPELKNDLCRAGYENIRFFDADTMAQNTLEILKRAGNSARAHHSPR